MNLFDSLRVLARRWYLTVPGLLLATALAAGAWMGTSPNYTRSASLLLLPSQDSLPEDGNPYLYMSGLSQAADVVVRSVNSQENLDELAREYPGSTVTVERDPSTVTPVIAIMVASSDDGQTAPLLDAVVTRTTDALSSLQSQERIPARSLIGVQKLTADTASTASNKKRLMTAGAAGAGAAVLVVVLVSVAEGVLTAGRRRRALKAVRPRAEDGRAARVRDKDGAAA